MVYVYFTSPEWGVHARNEHFPSCLLTKINVSNSWVCWQDWPELCWAFHLVGGGLLCKTWGPGGVGNLQHWARSTWCLGGNRAILLHLDACIFHRNWTHSDYQGPQSTDSQFEVYSSSSGTWGSCMDWICLPPNFTCWSTNAPVPQNVTVFGDRVVKEVDS